MSDTLIRPEYQKTSAGHTPTDGVKFFSYRTGIGRYARISEDGQIKVQRGYNRSTYCAEVIGHGDICTKSGMPKRFHSQESAAMAAIKIWRELHK
jgi:hypothetical protein